jgi:hypothetical protein
MQEKQVSLGLCCFLEVPSLPAEKLIELRSAGGGVDAAGGEGGGGEGGRVYKNLGVSSFIG